MLRETVLPRSPVVTVEARVRLGSVVSVFMPREGELHCRLVTAVGAGVRLGAGVLEHALRQVATPRCLVRAVIAPVWLSDSAWNEPAGVPQGYPLVVAL